MQTKTKDTTVCNRGWKKKEISCAQAFHLGVHCEQHTVLALPGSTVSVQILSKKKQETSK